MEKKLYLLLKTNKNTSKGKYVCVVFDQGWRNAGERTIGILVKRMVKDLINKDLWQDLKKH